MNEKNNHGRYSKRVISAIIILWFVVALFGIAVITYQIIVSPEYASLDGLFGYVGIPMSGGIVTYLIKSALENRKKIENSALEEETEVDEFEEEFPDDI